MRIAPTAPFARILPICATLLLAGCSSGEYGDEEQQPPPRAIASALGQPFTTDANGNLQTTVRAGSEVVLSGKNSSKGPDDTGVPLIRFVWEQLDAGANAVHFVYRTANTVSFTAPQVAQNTTLRFKLTVSDARGNAAATEAHVLVRPVRDSDRFLQFLGADASFPIVFTTSVDVPANPGANVSDTFATTVTLTKLVSFIDRNQVPRSRIAVGQPVRVDTAWSAQLGTRTACGAPENPTLRLPIPRIDLDDALATPIAAFPEGTILSDVMEAADIDDVVLEVRVDFASTSSAVTNAGPRACINGASPVASSAVLSAEALYPSNAVRDSRAGAEAYYASIDPTNSKITLNAWLAANGFTPGVIGFNADAHAVYTNNYDLGFGRDMYMKFGACDAGAAALPLSQRGGRCDVASVVINYADVEGAVKRINPIVAVAMEYSAAPGTGARFVKFYTFTPDTRTGEYRRVLSVNLDRRGEQYMPQTCVVCHGGAPKAPQDYAVSADVGATFLPWDLDSFLYSDTDPGFSQKTRDAALRSQFTRARQEAAFKRLNEGAYLTYDANHPVVGRFALARELLEKWYGGMNMPAATFDDSAVPATWLPGGANGNPIGSNVIYRDVFARNCRACHVMHVPAGGDPRTATMIPPNPPIAAILTPPNAPVPANAISTCGNDARLFNTRVGVAAQVPMGCYWQFAHAPQLAERLAAAHMPFARRTMDRMWVELGNGLTAGQALQTHLQTQLSMTVQTPGTATAIAAVGPEDADIGGAVTLDGSASRFADSIAWNVDACTGTAAAPGACSRPLPVVGGHSPIGRFVVDGVATYRVTQTLNGTAATPSYFQVVDRPLSLATGQSVNFQIGGSGQLPSLVTLRGNGSLAQHTMRLTPSAGFFVAPAECAMFGCPANTTVAVTSSAVVQTTGSIAVQVTDAGGEQRSTTVSTLAESTFSAPLIVMGSPIVSANASANTLLGVLTQARLAVGRNDVVISSLNYIGPRAPTWSFDGATLAYRPNGGFATHGSGASDPQAVSDALLERFSYQLQRPDTGEVSASTIVIPIRARVSFNQMRSTWGTTASPTTCSGSTCHTGGAPTFGSLDYNSIRNGSLSRISGRPYVNLSNVEQSGLLCWPSTNCSPPAGGGVTHTGGSFLNSPLLTPIRQWLEDGANNF